MAQDRTPFEEEPLSLEPDDVLETEERQLRAFGAAGRDQGGTQQKFKRTLNLTGTGATRCRVFHSKISEAALQYMQDQINEWIDGESIEVKHIGHVIGTLEGKTPVPNMIVMVWY